MVPLPANAYTYWYKVYDADMNLMFSCDKEDGSAQYIDSLQIDTLQRGIYVEYYFDGSDGIPVADANLLYPVALISLADAHDPISDSVIDGADKPVPLDDEGEFVYLEDEYGNPTHEIAGKRHLMRFYQLKPLNSGTNLSIEVAWCRYKPSSGGSWKWHIETGSFGLAASSGAAQDTDGANPEENASDVDSNQGAAAEEATELDAVAADSQDDAPDEPSEPDSEIDTKDSSSAELEELSEHDGASSADGQSAAAGSSAMPDDVAVPIQDDVDRGNESSADETYVSSDEGTEYSESGSGTDAVSDESVADVGNAPAANTGDAEERKASGTTSRNAADGELSKRQIAETLDDGKPTTGRKAGVLEQGIRGKVYEIRESEGAEASAASGARSEVTIVGWPMLYAAEMLLLVLMVPAGAGMAFVRWRSGACSRLLGV